ncbi:putative holin-like toxin [Lacticaseibacillus kribbianus]|nr:putative holin-like toxin [Lacticaseibacillus kribbianus]
MTVSEAILVALTFGGFILSLVDLMLKIADHGNKKDRE